MLPEGLNLKLLYVQRCFRVEIRCLDRPSSCKTSAIRNVKSTNCTCQALWTLYLPFSMDLWKIQCSQGINCTPAFHINLSDSTAHTVDLPYSQLWASWLETSMGWRSECSWTSSWSYLFLRKCFKANQQIVRRTKKKEQQRTVDQSSISLSFQRTDSADSDVHHAKYSTSLPWGQKGFKAVVKHGLVHLSIRAVPECHEASADGMQT